MAENDVNREYKSSLFAWIFSDREAALSLYNSINGTEYDDPDSLEFTTIDTVIYMGMKNDVAFLFGGEMNLYEHQATWNPNMPEIKYIFQCTAETSGSPVCGIL